MSILVDGGRIAQKLSERIAETVEQMIKKPVMGVVIVSEDKVTRSYVNRKRLFAQIVGIRFVEEYLNEDITQEQLESDVAAFAATVDGLVVQLPLPAHIDQDAVLRLIPAEKDVDALNPDGSSEGVIAPVAGAVTEILRQYNINPVRRNCVVVGQGPLVGQPVIVELERLGALVSTADVDTTPQQLHDMVSAADIVISGAGVPGLITVDMLHEHSVVIDVGTSVANKTVVGDVHVDCRDVAAFVSPTPGGVGPITVAKLFENLIVLYTLAD